MTWKIGQPIVLFKDTQGMVNLVPLANSEPTAVYNVEDGDNKAVINVTLEVEGVRIELVVDEQVVAMSLITPLEYANDLARGVLGMSPELAEKNFQKLAQQAQDLIGMSDDLSGRESMRAIAGAQVYATLAMAFATIMAKS